MVFTTAGGGASQLYPYEIDNSLRFNDGDSPKVSRSISSSGSARNATFSVWVKRGILGTRQQIYSNKTADSAFDGMNMYFNASNDRLYIDHHDGTNYKSLYANMQFRDVSAWYHIVHTIDTTTGTATNRLRLYVNGTEITSFATDQEPSQNADLAITNSTGDQSIGDDPRDSNDLFDGYMAEYNFVDGTTLDPTYFGEFNNNGVWIPKKPNVSSYGTNGFYLEFKQTGTSANSSGIGADTSGNDNHMSVTNLAATDVTTDTPTNNFATMNPLDNYYSAHTMSEGNVKFVTNGSGDGPFQTATIGDLKTGKWYFEFKYTDPAHTGDGDAAGEFYGQIGICGSGLSVATDAAFSSFEHNFAYDSSNGRIKFNNTAGTVHGASISADGQIIGFLIDLDNNRVTTHLNGQYADGSGNHDESSPTAYVSVTAPASTPLGGYMIAFGENVGSSESGNQNTGTYEINFGNPSFAISSGNADANGYGNFEYAVPSGYYALCTKNLAEYG